MGNGREVEHITLEKTSDSSLGFSGGGLESDNRGELGIFVQETNSNNTIFLGIWWKVYLFIFLEYFYIFVFIEFSQDIQPGTIADMDGRLKGTQNLHVLQL